MATELLRFERAPTSAAVTGGFGDNYGGRVHLGVDYGCPEGTPIFAPAAGTVAIHQPGDGWGDGSFGTCVILDHVNTAWYSLYGHLSKVQVANRAIVRAGDVIGLSGNTGVTTGPHLHWQISLAPDFPRDEAVTEDPRRYLFTDRAPVAYSPQEEQWRPAIRAAFGPEREHIAMWVMHWESGGGDAQRGDGGAAVGLFQLHGAPEFPERPTLGELRDPRRNIAFAADLAGNGSGWSHWGGHGARYNGRVFGALGNHPYPGDPVVQTPDPSPDTALSARVGALEAVMGGTTAIQIWNGRGNSLLLGYAIEQQRLGVLAATVEQLAKTPSVGGIDRGAIVTALEQLSAQQRREADTIDALIKALSPEGAK